MKKKRDEDGVEEGELGGQEESRSPKTQPKKKAKRTQQEIDDDGILTNLEDGLPQRPATAPPALRGGGKDLNTSGIILVEDNAAIEKNMVSSCMH